MIQFSKRDGKPVVIFDGKTYVAISRILKAVGESPQIVKWRIDKAVKAAQEAAELRAKGDIDAAELSRRLETRALEDTFNKPRKAAADKGEQAHSLLECIASGSPEGIRYWKEKLPDAFNAIDQTLVHQKITIESAERYVFNEDAGYCARYDAAGTRRGQSIVLSFKKTRDIYPEHLLQASAEFHATFRASDSGKETWEPEDAAFLHLQTPGNCEFVFAHPAAHKQGLDAALALFDWKRKMGLL